jgi:hypothetical protein
MTRADITYHHHHTIQRDTTRPSVSQSSSIHAIHPSINSSINPRVIISDTTSDRAIRRVIDPRVAVPSTRDAPRYVPW